MADISYWELWNKYDKVLPKADLINLKKAIGLYANWTWAGSFVYLRRIFENLILDVYNLHKKDLKITEADFKIQKMKEKIKILKSNLPQTIVSMISVYKILSKWVHELTEEECLTFFPGLRLSIESILDQRIEEKNKKNKELKVSQEIEEINRKLGVTE